MRDCLEWRQLPDILRLISTKTLLKRSTVNKIIQESGRLAEFLKNPQEFYEKILEIIERNRHKLAIDGIKYIKLAGEEYYTLCHIYFTITAAAAMFLIPANVFMVWIKILNLPQIK